MSRGAIASFLSGLDELSRKLLEDYMDNEYVPKVRTGLGKKRNFMHEHNSGKGVRIVKEIIKFKRMQLKSGYISITLRSRVHPGKSNFGNKRTT